MCGHLIQPQNGALTGVVHVMKFFLNCDSVVSKLAILRPPEVTTVDRTRMHTHANIPALTLIQSRQLGGSS